MLDRKTSIVGGVIVLLLVANILNYFWSNWGLVTIHAKDEPIGKVIKSIEWQGWVKIYSNIDPNLKITMRCDRVPLPDAMETLAANVEYPAPPEDAGSATTSTGGTGRRGGLGGFGGAQWHLGFFVAPTSTQVKEEIRTFQEGADRDDENVKEYSYGAPLAMLGDEASAVADPRRQEWPGLKMPTAPAADAATLLAGITPTPEEPPNSVQGYLRAFARQSDVWIMSPAAWDSPVKDAPAPNDSIVSAIRHFVGSVRGSVTQGLILRGRPPRVAGAQNRGGGFRGGGGNFDLGMMEERVENAIHGLPPEAQDAARSKLADEKQLMKELRNLPPDQMMQRMRAHFIELRLDGDNSWRRSPEKRAQIYSRLVSNRMSATGK